MRIALVHDWLNQLGGAEDVLDDLVGMFPGAPVFTSMYWRDQMPAHYRTWDIRTTFMDRLPGIYRHHQPYLPVYPLAWDTLRLPDDINVVLSNKSGFCHGIHPPAGATHICYCLTPTRFLWGFEDYAARENLSPAVRALMQPMIALLRRWDLAAADRVDHFIAISTAIQQRIRTFYGRESEIIYPPVDTSRFSPLPPDEVGDYYLTVGRLIPYKRIDLVVEACTRLDLPLKVGGRGRDLARLQTIAGPTVEFLGYVPDDRLPDLMARARAFVFPGLEDFGITPVQAMAAGRPVIAFNGGGAPDYVRPGLTGTLFDRQDVDVLTATLRDFDASAFDPQAVRAFALQFDRRVFEQQLRAYIDARVRPLEV